MRERSIFWDVASVGLLFVITLLLAIAVLQSDRGERMMLENIQQVQKQNNEILSKLNQGARAPVVEASTPTQPPPSRNTLSASTSNVTPTSKIYDGSDLPKFERGDENADDGDSLVLNLGAEPNSLNPLIDNDASASELFGRANDSLAGRCYDDLKYWEPRLASSWEKSMICRGFAAQKNAKILAEKLSRALSPADRLRLKITKIEAESDEVLRIELADVSGDYRDEVLKILGADAIEKQAWLYVNFEGKKYADGKPVDAATTGEILQKAISATSDYKGKLQAPWNQESTVVAITVGGGDRAEKAVKDLVDSDVNKGDLIDPKSPTGTTPGKVLKYVLREDYVFEEKPVFTFHLRKDVKWHDNVPFTGKDIVFTFKTTMNPKVECGPHRNYLKDCESCELLNGDPYTVQFVWKKPYFMAFSISASATALPEHIFKFEDADEFNKSPSNQTLIGNGPYKLDKWDRKQRIVFVRNENYYGKKPHFKKVIYKVVADPTVALEMFMKGDLDLDDLSKAQALLRQKDEAFLKKSDLLISTANSYRYIGWNARLPMFESPKVRRALTMLVDRARIIKDVWRGIALPLHGPTHPDNPSYSPDVEKIDPDYNPAEAIKLLNEEGWRDTQGDNVLRNKEGQPFKFTLLIRSPSPEYESAASIIKNSFAQAGIVMNISNLEWSVLVQKIERHQFDAVIMGWRLAVDDDPYQLWHSSQTGEKASNFCNFVNPEADRLIEQYRRELDEDKRRQIYRRIQNIIVEQQPYTFLLVEKRAVAADRRIKNVKFKLIGSDDSRWWVPLNEQKY